MEARARRRRVRSQRHFKSSFLQPLTPTQPLTPSRVELKKPLEVPAQNLVPWMEIFCPGNREVLLHQALLSVKHRHAPQQTTKDPGRLLYRVKTASGKRTQSFASVRKLATAGSCMPMRTQTRAASRPSLSHYSSTGMREGLWSRGQSPKFLVAGLSPRSGHFPQQTRFEDQSASVSMTEMTPKSRTNTARNTRKPQDHFKLTYFNAEVIPEKPEKRMTVMDIRKYIEYLDSQPFK